MRVRTKNENAYAIAPICLSIDSQSGLIVSYSFSYGLPQVNLHELALLGLREKNERLVERAQMYRSTLGDSQLAERKLATDNFSLSLIKLKCPRPCTYDVSKAGVLFEHFFYDWDHVFISDIDSFKAISQAQFLSLLSSVVERFNRAVRNGDVCMEAKAVGDR